MQAGGDGGHCHGPKKDVVGGLTQVPVGVPSWHRFVAIAELEPK